MKGLVWEGTKEVSRAHVHTLKVGVLGWRGQLCLLKESFGAWKLLFGKEFHTLHTWNLLEQVRWHLLLELKGIWGPYVELNWDHLCDSKEYFLKISHAWGMEVWPTLENHWHFVDHLDDIFWGTLAYFEYTWGCLVTTCWSLGPLVHFSLYIVAHLEGYELHLEVAQTLLLDEVLPHEHNYPTWKRPCPFGNHMYDPWHEKIGFFGMIISREEVMYEPFSLNVL